MKNTTTAIIFALLGAASPLSMAATAAAPVAAPVTATPPATVAAAPAVNTQQNRMKSCNVDAAAKKLTGTDRQGFMKTCLSGGTVTKPLTAAQQRMKDCNVDATSKTLKGKDRQTFVSQCLKTH